MDSKCQIIILYQIITINFTHKNWASNYYWWLGWSRLQKPQNIQLILGVGCRASNYYRWLGWTEPQTTIGSRSLNFESIVPLKIIDAAYQCHVPCKHTAGIWVLNFSLNNLIFRTDAWERNRANISNSLSSSHGMLFNVFFPKPNICIFLLQLLLRVSNFQQYGLQSLWSHINLLGSSHGIKLLYCVMMVTS